MQAQIGQRAQQLLRDPLLVSAFEQIEARFTNDWRQSTLGQSDLREEVYRMLCALDEVRAHLTKLVRDGQYAAYTLEQRAERGR